MKATPLERRAARKGRNEQHVDMNLVALIDIFTILIFFLLSSAAGVELLAAPKPVKLPESTAERAPRQNVLIVVAGDDIFVDGRRVAAVGAALADEAERIGALEAALQEAAARGSGASAAGAVTARAVTLMADKDIPYRLLRKLMLSCAQASFDDVSFAVRQQWKVS